MTEGESFIEEFLQEKSIRFRPQQPIDGLEDDSKTHRVADFYLPQYGVYLEYFGQWNNDSHKDRYREKRQVYMKNQIPCVLLYPENLGILDYVFEKRMVYILKRYRKERELKKYRMKLFLEGKLERLIIFMFGLSLIVTTYPWTSERGVLSAGVCMVIYQAYLVWKNYKEIFKD
jgi:hypothetical protein